MADNRIAYGLAKKNGIDTKGMSPKEVWDALKGKGITPESVDKQEKEKKKQLEKKYNDDLKSPNVPEKAYGFANKERKNTRDHINHAKEMGFKNQDEYEEAACEFWEKGEGIVYQGRRRNDFVKYNPKTSQYIAIDKEGIVKTFYFIKNNIFEKKKIQEGYKKWK